MRILLVNDYATPTAGAELLTRDMRDSLNDRGHEVRTFASRAQLIPGKSFANATCFGTNTRLQTLSSTFNPSAARALKRELAAFRPDVVQVHMFLWQLSPSILPLLRDLPSIFYAMTFKAVCPTGLKWLPSDLPCVERAGAPCLHHHCITPAGYGPLMLQRHLWRRRRGDFAAIIATSQAVRALLEADGISVRDVIWPGILITPPRSPLTTTPLVTFAGRLTHEKGVEVLIRAFARTRERIPAARLLVAGTGPDEAQLRALVAGLGLSDAVDMPGQIDRAQLGTLFDSAWVHVVPSLWPEPFGLTATEAMMRGTAVIASRTGGLAESVTDQMTGMLIEPGDETGLAEALVRVLTNRELAERLGTAARHRAITHFSLEQCVARFEILYDELRRERPRHSDAS